MSTPENVLEKRTNHDADHSDSGQPQPFFLDAYNMAGGPHPDGLLSPKSIIGIGGAYGTYALGEKVPFLKDALPMGGSFWGVGLSLALLGRDIAYAGYDTYRVATGKEGAGVKLCMDVGGAIGAGASLWMARGVGGGIGLGFRSLGMDVAGEMAGSALYNALNRRS